jgi:hypothetical protein
VFANVPEAERLFTVACLVVLLSVVLHGGGIALLLRRRGDAGPISSQVTGRRATLPVLEELPRPELAQSADVPERITIDEVRDLWAHGEPVVLVDVRTDRTYRADELRARGAVRVPPEDPVRSARQLGLDHHGTLVIYCA